MKHILLTALIFTTTCYPSNLKEAIKSLSPNKQSAEIKTGWTDEQKESLANTLVNINYSDFPTEYNIDNCDQELIENYLAALGNDPIKGRKNSFTLSNFCSSIKEQVDSNSDFEFSLIAEDSKTKNAATFPHFDFPNRDIQGYRIFLPLVGPATIIAKDMPKEKQTACQNILHTDFENLAFTTKEHTDYPITWQEIPQGTAIIGGTGNLGNSLFHRRPETNETRLFVLATFTKLKETEN